MLLWLWCSCSSDLPLAWELSYATGLALKKKKKMWRVTYWGPNLSHPWALTSVISPSSGSSKT